MSNNVPQPPPARLRNRLEPLAMIAVFDIAGPLVTYSTVRSAGLGAVPALLLSGVFPALGVLLGFARHRQVDAVGSSSWPVWPSARSSGWSAAMSGWSSPRGRYRPRSSASPASARYGPAGR